MAATALVIRSPADRSECIPPYAASPTGAPTASASWKVANNREAYRATTAARAPVDAWGAARTGESMTSSFLFSAAQPGHAWGRGTAERPGSRPGLERNTKPRNDCSSIRDLLVLHRHDHREPGATRWCQNAATAIAARPVPIRWLGMEGCSLQGGGVAEGRVHPPVRLDHARRGSRVCRGGRQVRMPFTEQSGQTRFQRAEIPRASTR